MDEAKWAEMLRATIPTTADVNNGGVYDDLSVGGGQRPRFAPTDATLSTNNWRSGSYDNKAGERTTWTFRGNAYGGKEVDASSSHGHEYSALVD